MKEPDKINVDWSEEDECYVATIANSDLIGCGDTPEEAEAHLKNHIMDEMETPRKKKTCVV